MDEQLFASKYNNHCSFSYMTFNIQSLPAKFNLLQELIQSLINSKCEPDIIFLQEIWKLPDSSLFNLTGYNFIFKTRGASQGGGVGMYIKNNYRFNILETNSLFIDQIIETLFIEVWLSSNKKIILGTVYRPAVNHPQLTVSEQFNQFFELFSNLLDNLSQLDTRVIIGGDFNLDALKYRTASNVTNYIDMLFSYGFLQLIMKPTRCSASSATLIDHILSNNHANLHETIILKSLTIFPLFTLAKIKKQEQYTNYFLQRFFRTEFQKIH